MSLVKNLADPEQVKRAGDKIKLAQMQAENDMRTLLAMPEYRRFVAWLFAECRISASVWSPSAAIHRDAGRQELGHAVARKIVEVDKKALSELLTDAYERELQGEKL